MKTLTEQYRLIKKDKGKDKDKGKKVKAIGKGKGPGNGKSPNLTWGHNLWSGSWAKRGNNKKESP